ncbi:hypothetical protein FWK35_00010644 [Aphis craccivora]|uniref:Uncharacterized protein n=1 Tax=Aphis craccivora TaxID=307492 RepID=A0A6G0ZG47_APHCR|nr:hypothetical protein FWK35_00010644 [Aphis craccivora]
MKTVKCTDNSLLNNEQYNQLAHVHVLDSERSDECIDFTMMMVSDVKVNILEAKSKYFPLVLKKSRKTIIFTQNQFSTKSIFLYGCNSKTNDCKYLKFSPNFYLNFQKLLTFFDLNVDKNSS